MAKFVLSGQDLFGRYARIAYGYELDGKQNYHIYKCIQSFSSNAYCDVPLTYQTENNCYIHDDITEVVNVIHCGIDESRVIRVALKDIELLPAADAAPVRHGRWIATDEWMTDECSNCGARINIEEFDDCAYHPKEGHVRLNYCPSCGAKMNDRMEAEREETMNIELRAAREASGIAQALDSTVEDLFGGRQPR